MSHIGRSLLYNQPLFNHSNILTRIFMPWDEKDDSRNPWNKSSGGNGPPDLFEILKKMFGGFGGGRSSMGGSMNWGVIIAGLLILWGLSSIYIVSEGQRGVILRFGEYADTTLPGPHWHIPYPIETVEKVDIARIRSAQNQSRMLTQDENIVEVELAVQYRIKSAADYLFNIRLPDVEENIQNQSQGTLFQVMESSLREVVGKSKMDFVLGEGRAEIAANIKESMSEILDSYRSGMEIVTVNLQQSQPPEAVQGAFADVIKAREDEIRYINEAEAYVNGILPQARGEAARIQEDANAYKEQVIDNSLGEASRFLAINAEYLKAPEVTRKRLYIQALESVLSESNKVIIDVDKGSNVFYLPLDRMMKDANQFRSMGKPNANSASSQSSNQREQDSNTSGMSGTFNDMTQRVREQSQRNLRRRGNAN